MPLIIVIIILISVPSSWGKNVTKIKDLQVALEKNPENIKLRKKLAKLFYAKKNYDELIELLNPYTSDIPFTTLGLLASSYHEKSDFNNEIRVRKIVVDKKPKRPKAHLLLGKTYMQSKKTDLAITSFRTAVKLNKKYKPAYQALVAIFNESNNKYEARLVLQDMLVRFGHSSTTLGQLCRLYSIDGFLKEAQQTCQLAIKKAPKIPDNYVYLAQSTKDLKDEKRAEHLFKRAAKKFPKSEIAVWAAADYYSDKKNYPVASRYYKYAVKADPKSWRAQFGLAKSEFKLKKYIESLQAYKSACKLDRKTYSNLALAAGQLRQESNYAWSSKFSRVAYSCQNRTQ